MQNECSKLVSVSWFSRFEEVEVTRKKTKTKRFDCTIHSQPASGCLNASVKAQFHESEVAMAADDRSQHEAKEMMNNLESYIYSMRNRLQDDLSPFASPDDAGQLTTKLAKAEEWVYDNPEGTKEMYASKLQELKVRLFCQLQA